MSSVQARSVTRKRGFGYRAVVALGIVLILFGLPIFGGGAYLILLGGSWYYLFAGAGLLLTAFALFRGSLSAVSIYLLTYLGTVIWAFWEKGFDWWAQVPRLVAPTVILILLIACMPVLSRLSRPRRRR